MYDVVVIGAGIIGSWTAHHLAKMGQQILLLDQFALPHTRGSSYGHSRLTKRSHRRKHCSDLIPEAMSYWAELEKLCGMKLLLHTGHLSITDKTTTGELINDLKSHMDREGVHYKAYKGIAIKNDFPGMHFDDKFEAFFEDNGVVLKADKCLQALWNTYRERGGTIRDEEKVLSVKVISENVVHIETEKNFYRAKAVVLACGPWIKDIANKLGLNLPTEAKMVKTHHWKVRDTAEGRSNSSRIPFVLYISGYHIYSTPDYEYPGMVKVCYHHRTPADPDARDKTPPEADKNLENQRFQILRNAIKQHFTYLEPEPAITETFLQTMTPDGDFILDHHPCHKNVVIGAGFSGHGFGPAPAIGRILANLATNQPQDYNLRPFSLRRNFARANL